MLFRGFCPYALNLLLLCLVVDLLYAMIDLAVVSLSFAGSESKCEKFSFVVLSLLLLFLFLVFVCLQEIKHENAIMGCPRCCFCEETQELVSAARCLAWQTEGGPNHQTLSSSNEETVATKTIKISFQKIGLEHFLSSWVTLRVLINAPGQKLMNRAYIYVALRR